MENRIGNEHINQNELLFCLSKSSFWKSTTDLQLDNFVWHACAFLLDGRRINQRQEHLIRKNHMKIVQLVPIFGNRRDAHKLELGKVHIHKFQWL